MGRVEITISLLEMLLIIQAMSVWGRVRFQRRKLREVRKQIVRVLDTNCESSPDLDLAAWSLLAFVHYYKTVVLTYTGVPRAAIDKRRALFEQRVVNLHAQIAKFNKNK
jgi:ribosomal protein L29